MARLSPNERQRRIIQLSSEWGVNLPPAPGRLERPPNPTTYRTPNDDQTAEDLLQRHAIEVNQGRPKSGLSRAFSSNNLKKGKNWEPKHILEVLAQWISENRAPGVAEALIAKLAAAGVELNPSQTQKSGILNRRKSSDSLQDRSKLLRLATGNNSFEMVQVLLPHADPFSLDNCLPTAIRQGNSAMVELMLRYGANVAQTADGQDAFRQACGMPQMAGMVQHILMSDGRPSQALASQSMTDAARVGSLETVLHLSRSVADGDVNQAEALRLAVEKGRGDIAVAIIMGNKPPQTPGLNQAFSDLIVSQSLVPNTKIRIAELLLCAGAQGDVLSQALQIACDSRFYEMASLLAAHGVSIEYENAVVVKTAIQQGQFDLVQSLLNDSSTLNPALASSCVSVIPQQAANADRYTLLSLLLKKGAKGTPLHDMLIVATEAGDISSIELLLKPFFPSPATNSAPNGYTNGQNGHVNGNTNGQPNGQIRRKSQYHLRHEVASTDYRDGEALRTAVLRVDARMTGAILQGQPSADTLSKVFPLTKKLSTADRYHMVELFLKSALCGPPLHAALHDAIADDPSARDDSLIQLLLDHDADINYNHGAGLHAVIMQADLQLLDTLMNRASPQTAAACVPSIIKMSNHETRYNMMSLMIRAGAAVGVEQICSALLQTLQEKAVDLSLLQLLLEHGCANINHPQYPIVREAVLNPDPGVLRKVFHHGKPSAETISKSLFEIVSLPSTDVKTCKLGIALERSTRAEDLGNLLITEVKSLIQNSSRQPSFTSLQTLLDAGADANAYGGAALCQSVEAASLPISDMLFECQNPPNAASLGLALPWALKIPELMDRLSFTKKLIAAGAPPLEANRALVYAINRFPEDISLLKALAAAADMSDGEALALAASREFPEVIDVLLDKSQHSEEAKDSAFERSMSVKDRAIRRRLCTRLLKEGISGHVASNALTIAAGDGDLELGDILMAHGASISSNNGKAIIEACRGGSAEVVEVLLRSDGRTHKDILLRAFQAATEVGDMNKRGVIFDKLLKRGVSGDIVDSQLISAARSGSQGHELLRVLLAAGADPNFKHGEAIAAATRSAFVRSLQLLLGLWDEEGRQKKPSHPTLIEGLRAAWKLEHDTRFRIFDDLFKAGLTADEEVHGTLNKAVNEENPDERLVKLLVDNGASPTVRDCTTLVDACRNGTAGCLKVLLERPLPQEAINQTFSRCFAPDNFQVWFSEAGKKNIQLLLDKGAEGGALSEMLLQVMKGYTNDTLELADEFFELLVSHGLDVNFNSGEPLQLAASQAQVSWTNQLLACRPSTESLSYAFQHIFDTPLDQDDALELFELFSEYRDGETHVDVMAQKPGSAPALVRAMSNYPRSTKILETLLDAGFYHDQATWFQLYPEVEEEEMTLLTWAIGQPQKKISSSLIKVLLERGANVNRETKLSGTTPLMLAVQARRADIVEALLLNDADVDVTDYKGRSPLSMAGDIGGDLSIKIMGSLLACEPSRDDGSLHNAARELNLPAVKVLIQAGHDPDFPSPNHQGRSALGEVCYKGSSTGELTPDRQKAMHKVMTLLIDQGSDLSIKTATGASMLHLCFEARDPLTTSRVFLKAGMWKYINKPVCQYTFDDLIYSPTMYVKKLIPESDVTDSLLTLLYSHRATDAFFAPEGAQPEGAVGLPEDIKVQERARKARIDRMSEETEEFAVAMARKRELANVENQIWAKKSQMEDARRQKLQNEDLVAIQSRARLEENLATTAHQRRISEQRSITDSSVNRARAIAAAETEAVDTRQRKMLEWEGKANRERMDNERALSALRISEVEDVDRVRRQADERANSTLNAQRKVIEGQERLAKRIANGQGLGQRQIGYVAEELN